MPFWYELGSYSFPKWTKIFRKTDPRMHQFLNRFLEGSFIHFSFNLGPNLKLSWSLFRSKWKYQVKCLRFFCLVYAIKKSTESWKTRAECRKTRAESWKTFHESLKTSLGPTWPRFGKCLAPFWHPVGAILGLLGARRWHWMGWWGYAKR